MIDVCSASNNHTHSFVCMLSGTGMHIHWYARLSRNTKLCGSLLITTGRVCCGAKLSRRQSSRLDVRGKILHLVFVASMSVSIEPNESK